MAWRDEVGTLNQWDGQKTLNWNSHSDSHNTEKSVLEGIRDDPGFAIVSSTAPSSPVNNQLWLDISSSPIILKRWNNAGGTWMVVGSQASEISVDPTSLSEISTNDIQAALGEIDNSVNNHNTNTSNPHNVTASQVNAVPTADVNGGTSTHNGDDTTTMFQVPHGLSGTPTVRNIWAESADAAGNKYVSAVDDTNIEVTFATPPVSGTDNVVLGFDVRL